MPMRGLWDSDTCGLADVVSSCFLMEFESVHFQVGGVDGRENTAAERQGNGHISAHSIEKGGSR